MYDRVSQFFKLEAIIEETAELAAAVIDFIDLNLKTN